VVAATTGTPKICAAFGESDDVVLEFGYTDVTHARKQADLVIDQ
jgi:hypothetical protein